MFKKKEIYIFYMTTMFFMALAGIFTILYHKIPFLHMLSVSLNMFLIPNMIKADSLYLDGSIALYNHHPYFAFWLFGLVMSLFENLEMQYISAGILSAWIFIIGYAVVYKMLRYFKYSILESVIAILVVMSIGGSVQVMYMGGYDTFLICVCLHGHYLHMKSKINMPCMTYINSITPK